MRPGSLEKFQQIYQQTYGIRLEEHEAADLATNLLNLYKVVYLEKPPQNISQKYEENVPPPSPQS